MLEKQRQALDGLGAHLLRARLREFLGHGYLLAGRLDDAEACAMEALALARRGHERGIEAWALQLRAAILARRDPAAADVAASAYREALALATDLGVRPLMVRCHAGLAGLARRAGTPDADTHLRSARSLARETGIPLADAVLG